MDQRIFLKMSLLHKLVSHIHENQHSDEICAWVILTIMVTLASYTEKSKSSSFLPKSGMVGYN